MSDQLSIPIPLTPERRLTSIAAILARGIVRLRQVAEHFESQNFGNSRLPSAGNVVVRKYKGQEIRVLILADGFEYQGQRFRSLSAIAKLVTGSRSRRLSSKERPIACRRFAVGDRQRWNSRSHI